MKRARDSEEWTRAGLGYEATRKAAQSGELEENGWRLVRNLATAGDAKAQFLLTFSALTERTKRKWLKRAAHGGHGEAFYKLHQCYMLGDVDGWLERSAELGCSAAQCALGCYLATCDSPNLVGSRYWYLQAALQGERTAMYETGFNYLLGDGGPAEPKQATEWLEKAAQLGHDEAQRLLTDLYTGGGYGV